MDDKHNLTKEGVSLPLYFCRFMLFGIVNIKINSASLKKYTCVFASEEIMCYLCDIKMIS